MRLLSLRLIVSLIVGVTLVSLSSSYYQVLSEKRSLRADLDRRAGVFAESLASNVERTWEKGSTRELQRIVQRFGNREHLVGVAIYDPRGTLVAATTDLEKLLTQAPPALSTAIAQNRDES